MKKCPSCNSENLEGVNFCGKCGASLETGSGSSSRPEESKTLPFEQFNPQGQIANWPDFNSGAGQGADLRQPVLQSQAVRSGPSVSSGQNKNWLWGMAVVCLAVALGLGGWLLGNNMKSPSSSDEKSLASQLKETKPVSEATNPTPAPVQTDSQPTGQQDRAVVNQSLSSYNWDGMSASSALGPEGKLRYDPPLVKDGDINTAWVEGRPDAGINEWVRLESRQSRPVSRIEIVNGYAASERLFMANNRPSKLKIEFSDGATLTANLKDGYGKENIIQLPKPVTTSSIKFTILDVYTGNKYNDTCIAEIRVY
ncbi:MAG: discoidin domain-containing protein [Syntrophomonadaceae bacterium]